MVRISDILKKKMGDNAPDKETGGAPKEEKAPLKKEESQDKISVPEEARPVPVPEGPSPMQISLAMKELEPDIERSRVIYGRWVLQVEELLKAVNAKKDIETRIVKDVVDEFVNFLLLGDSTLSAIFYEDYSPAEYLKRHIVNVMIISVRLSQELGYNRSQLDELAQAAFLHDIGMAEFIDTALLPRQLSPVEYNQIREHPVSGAAILASIKGLSEPVVQAVKECHERFDGKGYPRGLKDKNICEYARIIATVDVYEALTHTRPYRKKYQPHDAIKELLTGSGSLFDPAILKTLINLIGIYPVASYVELNTAEIAKVVTSNSNFPLRPVVNIIFDSNRKRLIQPRLVNLAKQFNLYIKNQLSAQQAGDAVKADG